MSNASYYPSNAAWIVTSGVGSSVWYPRNISPKGIRYGQDGTGILNGVVATLSSPAAPGGVIAPAYVQPVAPAGGMASNDGALSVKAYTTLMNFSGAAGNATQDLAIDNTTLFAQATDTTTATFTSPNIVTFNAKSVSVLFNVTAFSDTSYSPEVDYKDANGNTRILWKQNTAKTGAADTIVNIGVPPAGGGAQVSSSTTGDATFANTDSATANQLVTLPWLVPRILIMKVTKVHAAGAYTGAYSVLAS